MAKWFLSEVAGPRKLYNLFWRKIIVNFLSRLRKETEREFVANQDQKQGVSTRTSPWAHPFGSFVLSFASKFPGSFILDIGGGGDRYLNLPGYVNLDVQRSSNTTVLGDAQHLPFRENTFDLIILESVIEHVRKPWIVGDETYTVCKEEGYVYVEGAFLQPLHGYPSHYFNTTREGLKVLFEDFQEIRSGVQPNQMPSHALLWFLIEMIYGVFPKLATVREKPHTTNISNCGRNFRQFLSTILKVYDRFVDEERAEIIAAGCYYIGRKAVGAQHLVNEVDQGGKK
jgi:predicted SAM-dependent methyltransferase